MADDPGERAEPENAPEPEDAPGAEQPPRRRRGRILVVVLGLVALGAVATAGALWSSRADLERGVERQDEITSVAARFAEALLTYDHEDLDASRDAVTELATDDFADEYVGAFDAGLGGQIETLEATSTSTIREVFVARSDGDTARAIVIADSEIQSAAGSRATVGTYLDITLVHLDGRWRVDDVTSVANAGSRLSPVPGSDAETDPSTSTTSTTSITAP